MSKKVPRGVEGFRLWVPGVALGLLEAAAGVPAQAQQPQDAAEAPVEIEEVVMEDDGPYWNQELPESVVLPTIEPTGAPLWDRERHRRHGSDGDDKLLTELGIDATLPEVK